MLWFTGVKLRRIQIIVKYFRKAKYMSVSWQRTLVILVSKYSMFFAVHFNAFVALFDITFRKTYTKYVNK